MKRAQNGMTRFAVKLGLAVALVGVLATTSGCFHRVRIDDVTQTHRASRSIAAAGATAAATRIAFGAGELTVERSDLASDAVSGDFTYAPSNLEPELSSSIDPDGVLHASVRQPDEMKVPLTFGGPVNIRQAWDVKLSDALPTDLVLDMGAGDAHLDLAGVDLTGLEVSLGAGQTTIDLTGPRMRELKGSVQAGVGQLVIRLPKATPVRIFGSQDGIGDFRYDSGFTKDGNELTNDAWRASETGSTDYKGRIDLNVQRAVGEVRIELVD